MKERLDFLKRVVRSSPLASRARWCYRRIWPLTLGERDARYNFETEEVMKRVLRPDSTCLDIGAHVGSVLQTMMRLAPQGQHWAFEPLPAYAAHLRKTFPGAIVHERALSNRPGRRTFQHAIQNPGYSGFLPHAYPLGDVEAVETITVETARLDELVPAATPVRFVKVDVEGAELEVFEGGRALLAAHRPYIVFEHGIGSADHYGTRPEPVYDLLAGCGLTLTTMARWLGGQRALTRAQFIAQFEGIENFYFLAYEPG